MEGADAGVEVRVLLVDDDPTLRFAARLQLDLDGRYRVVAECHNGLDAVALAQASQPDVVLLDLELPFLPGADLVAIVHEACPASAIVAWTVAPDIAAAERALAQGASAVLDKRHVHDRTLADRLSEVLRRTDEISGPGSPSI